MPFVKYGDNEALDNFALAVHSLVGMLKSLEGDESYELQCGSHVDRLLSKLSPNMRDSFVEHCISHGVLKSDTSSTYTLIHLSNWLQTKSRARRIASQAVPSGRQDSGFPNNQKVYTPTTSVLSTGTDPHTFNGRKPKGFPLPKAFCAFCNSAQHHISNCADFKKLTTDETASWIKDKSRCWKCARSHKIDDCNLKKICHTCNNLHLTCLHDAVQKGASQVYSIGEIPLYIDQPPQFNSVLLKVVPILIHGPTGQMRTYALLDDGSMRTMVLMPVVKKLNLRTEPDQILLTTIRSEPFNCVGYSVNLTISPVDNHDAKFEIHKAFASNTLALSEYNYPVKQLQSRFDHLRDAPLPSIDKVKPLILIGSDHADLILPKDPIQFGPQGVPVAVCTKLGWSLQGPSESPSPGNNNQQCLLTVLPNTYDQLKKDVVRLWEMDVMHSDSKQVTRSKQDKFAIETLEIKTEKVIVNDELHYATPLLRKSDHNALQVGKESVFSNLK